MPSSVNVIASAAWQSRCPSAGLQRQPICRVVLAALFNTRRLRRTTLGGSSENRRSQVSDSRSRTDHMAGERQPECGCSTRSPRYSDRFQLLPVGCGLLAEPQLRVSLCAIGPRFAVAWIQRDSLGELVDCLSDPALIEHRQAQLGHTGRGEWSRDLQRGYRKCRRQLRVNPDRRPRFLDLLRRHHWFRCRLARRCARLLRALVNALGRPLSDCLGAGGLVPFGRRRGRIRRRVRPGQLPAAVGAVGRAILVGVLTPRARGHAFLRSVRRHRPARWHEHQRQHWQHAQHGDPLGEHVEQAHGRNRRDPAPHQGVAPFVPRELGRP
ncbi:hypothetical protein GBAR_LOCUS16109 [Geodia barretti]|uniref:Uncharacterized protein n=1 Tax=Geodia barretti TaxID=519541 RepID=A0AA35SDY3_GEOBA|nr:hypothetical protein GBAR_LOCUS16109 [Geodia barretti]